MDTLDRDILKAVALVLTGAALTFVGAFFTLPKLCISEKLLYFCHQTKSLTNMKTKRHTPLILKLLLLPLFLIWDAVEQTMNVRA